MFKVFLKIFFFVSFAIYIKNFLRRSVVLLFSLLTLIIILNCSASRFQDLDSVVEATDASANVVFTIQTPSLPTDTTMAP